MAVAALDHPYICKIFEIGEDGGVLCLVMEYIAGDTLERRLQAGQLPPCEALRDGRRWPRRWRKRTPADSSTAI